MPFFLFLLCFFKSVPQLLFLSFSLLSCIVHSLCSFTLLLKISLSFVFLVSRSYSSALFVDLFILSTISFASFSSALCLYFILALMIVCLPLLSLSLSLSLTLSPLFSPLFYVFNRFLCSSRCDIDIHQLSQAIEMQLDSTTGSFNCSSMPHAACHMPHLPPLCTLCGACHNFFEYFLRFWLALIELHEHIHQKCIRIYIACIDIYVFLHICSIFGIYL